MIKIDDEYRINADTHCYSLEKVGIIEDKESKNYGSEVAYNCGYYTTLDESLRGYIKTKTREYISKDTYNTLKELLEEITKLENFIKDKFKKV